MSLSGAGHANRYETNGYRPDEANLVRRACPRKRRCHDQERRELVYGNEEKEFQDVSIAVK